MPNCNLCEQEFGLTRQLTHHNSEYHSNVHDLNIGGTLFSVERNSIDNTLVCPVSGCLRIYITRTAFKRHVDRDHGEQPSSTISDTRSPSPLNGSVKRGSNDEGEMAMKCSKKVKKVDNLIESKICVISGYK
jgi:hypothetical protein